jgi:hypothetical protein
MTNNFLKTTFFPSFLGPWIRILIFLISSSEDGKQGYTVFEINVVLFYQTTKLDKISIKRKYAYEYKNLTSFFVIADYLFVAPAQLLKL